MTNDTNRTNTSGSQTSKQGFNQNQGTGGSQSNDQSRKAGDTMAKEIGRHADDGVRTNSLEKDGAKQAPSRTER